MYSDHLRIKIHAHIRANRSPSRPRMRRQLLLDSANSYRSSSIRPLTDFTTLGGSEVSWMERTSLVEPPLPRLALEISKRVPY